MNEAKLALFGHSSDLGAVLAREEPLPHRSEKQEP
jgi:hypothetical protein